MSRLQPRFFQMQSFVENKNSSNLGPKMSYLGIFKQELKKLLSYLKSAPSNLSNCNVYLKFGTKDVVFG